MTNLQEAKLAREAEICYATMALVTDYDVWHETEEDVSVDSVVAILRQNAATARAVLRAAVTMIPAERSCACAHALRDAIITAREKVPAGVKRELAPIVGKYLGRMTRCRCEDWLAVRVRLRIGGVTQNTEYRGNEHGAA